MNDKTQLDSFIRKVVMLLNDYISYHLSYEDFLTEFQKTTSVVKQHPDMLPMMPTWLTKLTAKFEYLNNLPEEEDFDIELIEFKYRIMRTLQELRKQAKFYDAS